MDAEQKTKRIVVLIIVCVSSAIALATIAAAIVHPYLSTLETPSILENWGGLIIGFYFGTFVSLLKEWLTGNSEEKGHHGSHNSDEQDRDGGIRRMSASQQKLE